MTTHPCRFKALSTLALASALLCSIACAAEESFDESDPFNSDVVSTGDEKADEAAALTGFIVLGDGDTMPEGLAAVYNIDGFQIAEIDIGEYEALAEAGQGSLFASPVFSPADGREISTDEGEGGGQSSFAPSDLGKEQGGSTDQAPNVVLNPFHCNQSGVLNPIPGVPPCNASARWVTPRSFAGPSRDYAYLLYRLEYLNGDAEDEYPYGTRTWWGWGGTVELHKAALLWSSDEGSFNKTDASAPVGSRFKYDEKDLVRSSVFEREGLQIVAVFLKLPLVFTE